MPTRRRSFGMGLFIDKALSKGDCLAVALFPVIALNWRSAAQPARAGRSGRSAGGARRSSSASRARELSAIKANALPKLLIFQCCVFGRDPVAEPPGAAGGRSSNIIISKRPSSSVRPQTGIVLFPFGGGLFGTCLWVAPIVAIDGGQQPQRRPGGASGSV